MAQDWQEKSNRNMGAMFDETVAHYHDKEALVFRDRRFTYGQLQEKVNRLAKGLLKLGVKKGDHVAIWGTNKPEWVYAQFAALKLGASITPLNTRYKTSEAEYIIRQADAGTLVFEETFLGKIDAVKMVREMAPELDSQKPGKLSLAKFPKLKNIICWSPKGTPCVRARGPLAGMDEVMALGDDPALDKALVRAQAAVSPDDIGYVMYTSGTTGFPKGAELPHRNTLAMLEILATLNEVTDKSTALLMVPIFGNVGSTGTIIKGFCRGAKVVMVETFEPEEAMRTIEREKVTLFSAIPSMLIMMLAHESFGKYDLSSLETVSFGGAPLTPGPVAEFRAKVGVQHFLDCYGSVEGTGVSNVLSTRFAPLDELGRSVGPALPFCKVKIVDTRTLEDLPEGKEGEIWVGNSTKPGCAVMKGYYNKPDETNQAIVGGWLRTGDIGKLRPDGYLQLTGRLKEMVLVGGFNVYPAEVEAVLGTHAKVEMSAVVGIPDPRLGEVPCAFVKLKRGESGTAEEIIEFCRGKMANMKVPREVRFVTQFPMTASGKIQKFLLKEQAGK